MIYDMAGEKTRYQPNNKPQEKRHMLLSYVQQHSSQHRVEQFAGQRRAGLTS
jgi:hypothetical protein